MASLCSVWLPGGLLSSSTSSLTCSHVGQLGVLLAATKPRALLSCAWGWGEGWGGQLPLCDRDDPLNLSRATHAHHTQAEWLDIYLLVSLTPCRHANSWFLLVPTDYVAIRV